MESSKNVRRLLKQLLPSFYSCYVEKPAVPVTDKNFVPLCRLKYSSFQLLNQVLSVVVKIERTRWEKFIDISCVKMLMLSSNEMYLRYVIFSCRFFLKQMKFIFPGFVHLCALVISFSIETFEKTGINYCELSTDILMAVYENDLKEIFFMEGGFRGFKKYLLVFKDGFMPRQRNDFPSPTDVLDFADDLISMAFIREVTKAYSVEAFYPERITHEDIMSCSASQSLAKDVLGSTKIALPSLPSADELKARVRAAMQKKKFEKKKCTCVDVQKREGKNHVTVLEQPCEERVLAKSLEGSDTSLQQCSCLNSNAVQQDENVLWYENVVQAVIEHNSKYSLPANQFNPVQKEILDVITHLKSNIKSLIGLLDKYDKEY